MNYFKDMWTYYFGNKKKYVIIPFNPGKKLSILKKLSQLLIVTKKK